MSELIPFHEKMDEISCGILNDIRNVKETATSPKEWTKISTPGGLTNSMLEQYRQYASSIGICLFGQQSKHDNENYTLFAWNPKATKSRTDQVPPTEDEISLCLFVAESAKENGYKIENPIKKTDILAARTVLKRARELNADLDAVMSVVEWALNDHFWKSNCRSMNNVSKNWDKFREASKKNRKTGDSAKASRKSTLESAFDNYPKVKVISS